MKKNKVSARDMLKNFSAKRFIAALFVVFFFVALIITYNTFLYMSIREDILKSGEISAMESAEQFDRYLSTGVDAIKLTSHTLDSMNRRNATSEDITSYLEDETETIISSLVPNTTGLYAYIHGEFFDGSGWVPGEDYEPTQRPWYKEAFRHKGQVVIVDPYVDMQTGSVILTLAKSLGDGKSVVALDLTMDAIQEMIEQKSSDSSVIARMVICSNGTVVAHSDKEECGKNYREEAGTLGNAVVEKLYTQEGQYFEVDHNGSSYIVYLMSIGNDWFAVSVAGSATAYLPLTILAFASISAVLVSVVILGVVFVLSAKRKYTADGLNSQLSSAADIYLSMSEIDLVNKTIEPIKNFELSVVDDIRQDTDNVQEVFNRIMGGMPDEDTKHLALEFVDMSTLGERLADTNCVTQEFISYSNIWVRARFVASARDGNGNVTKVLWMLENIDAEKRTRDELSEKTRKLTAQLSSAADIYMSLCDIDVINNEVTAIKNVNPAIAAVVDSCDHNMQELFFKIMTGLPESPTKQAAIEFSDMSTIDERMGDKNSLTLEYISYGNIWVRARYVVSERTDTGKISHVLWMLENIDAEKKARDKLTHRADKLTAQLSSTADIYISLCDLDLVNNTITEIKNSDPLIAKFLKNNANNMREALMDSMKGLPDSPAKKAAVQFADLSTIDARLGTSKSLTHEYLSYGNIWVRARFVPSERDSDGKLTHVLWMLENIDAEKKDRDKLYAFAEKLTHQLSSTAKIYMSMYDFDLTNDTFSEVKATNAQVVDIIGDNRKGAQATVNKVMCMMADESYVGSVLEFIDLSSLPERLADSDTITIEYLSADHEWRRGRFIASERSRDGGLLHVLWMVEDIDKERRDREDLLNKSERAIAANEAKSEFISNMSHEIRTPINAVLGMNEMVLRESSEPEIIRYAENVRTAGNTLLGLINDILDFSKIEAGKLQIIPVDYDLASVLYDLMNMIRTRAEAKKLAVIPIFDRDTPRFLNGDEVRIKQVITNILTNAVKYTREGTITFMVGFDRIDGENISLRVAVKDTGVGIKPEDMERLFTKYERIDEQIDHNVEGTGLGISITQSLLSMMGSELKAESVYGKGSMFSFSAKQKITKDVPIGDYEEAFTSSVAGRRVYKERFTAPDARVLVIDDTPMNLMVFMSLLKATNCKIETAESGDEGIAKALGTKYDMIFLDHMMPGKDGIETLGELRAAENSPNVGTPVVCLTANVVSGARERYLEAGFDDYLPKPIEADQLEEMMIKYLPKNKVQMSDNSDIVVRSAFIPDFIFDITEIDIAEGIKNTGSEELYLETLRSYVKMTGTNIEYAQKFWKKGRLNNLVIIIHTLKSSARMIGAEWIRRLAARLEEAGKNGDTKMLGEDLVELLDRCRLLATQLSPLLDELPQEGNSEE